MRETAGSAAAPAARYKNLRRGSFILNSLDRQNSNCGKLGARKRTTPGVPEWRTRRTLWPGKVAFSNDALVLFAGTLDTIFELAPTVRKLFGHLVGSTRHVTTYDGSEVYDLTDLEFM
jgi:hypothetical protein